MKFVVSLVKLARPGQWVKNIFVFTALIFSGHVVNIQSVMSSFWIFAAFCFASSSVYYLNDFKDVKKDRMHPKKKNRPLAKGDLPQWVGIAGFVFLFALSIIISWYAGNFLSTIIIAAYLITNVAYSFGLKHLVIIDVLIIAMGFVLRILAGAAAIKSIPSTWLVLCAVTISLFLGFTKRRAEVVALGEDAGKHRQVLSRYNVPFLDQMISIVTAATLVCYILYTVSPHTIEIVGSRLLIFSVPFVLYGIFRYLYLVYYDESGGDPTKTVFTDIPLIVTGLGWALFCSNIILFGKDIINLIK
jgi:4-hydroxybenzoate polyprenyltransferase